MSQDDTSQDDTFTDPTDRAVIEAGEALLDEAGELTMAAVARRAGISRGTVYRRFSDRDSLLARIAARRGVEVDALVRGPRTRLLDGAAKVLADEGPDGLTVEAVARASGLGVATLYRHFDGRDALLSAYAAERSPRRLVAALDASPGDDIAGDLSRLAEAGIRFVREQPGLVRLMLDHESAERLAAQLGRGRRARHALVDYFARQVEAGRLRGDPRQMALAFGGMLLALARDGAGDPAATARFITALMLDGVRPP